MINSRVHDPIFFHVTTMDRKKENWTKSDHGSGGGCMVGAVIHTWTVIGVKQWPTNWRKGNTYPVTLVLL